MIGWSLLTGLAAISHDLIGLIFFWSCMGLAQTGLVPGAAKSIASWFPPAGRAFGSGMFGASMALGGALAPLIASQLLELVTWRQLLGLYVLPGLMWAFAYVSTVPHRTLDQTRRDPVGETLGRIISSPSMLLLCAAVLSRPEWPCFHVVPTFPQKRGILNGIKRTGVLARLGGDGGG